MKKWVALLTGLCVMALSITSMAAPGGETSVGAAHTENEKKVEAVWEAVDKAAAENDLSELSLAYCVDEMAAYFSANAVEGAQKRCEELGIEFTVADSFRDPSTQASQAENMITKGVDGIFVKPFDMSACGPISEACQAAGIPLVTVSATISTWHSAWVGLDMYEVGQAQAQAAIDTLGEEFNVVILRGPMGMELANRSYQGAVDTLAEHPGITVIDAQDGNAMMDDSMRIVESWLTAGNDIDCIIAFNDAEGLGAVQAVKDAGLMDEIFIIGNGGEPDGLNSVKKGELDLTIYKPGSVYGRTAIDVMVDLLTGGEYEPMTMVKIPMELVTIDNVDEFMTEE